MHFAIYSNTLHIGVTMKHLWFRDIPPDLERKPLPRILIHRLCIHDVPRGADGHFLTNICIVLTANQVHAPSQWNITVKALILWTHLSLNIFATVSQIDTGVSSLGLDCKNWRLSEFLDSKINCESPVRKDTMYSFIEIWPEVSSQNECHDCRAYTWL